MKPIEFTLKEQSLILTLIKECENEGWYYGNKKQFSNQLTSLKEKILNEGKTAREKECDHEWRELFENQECRHCGLLRIG